MARQDVARKRPTMRDVAALAGVSFKTVSRVVNNEGGVSEDLAARVRDASARLDYRPNHTASVLRRQDGRTMTVALLVEDVANPFFAAIHRGVGDVAHASGYTVLSAGGTEPEWQQEIIETFAARRVDGFILIPEMSVGHSLAVERRSGTPLVYVDRMPPVLDGDVVASDHRAGTARGVTHLLERGHRRIAFLGDLERIQTAHERHAGYVEAHAAAGVRFDPALVVRDLHREDAAAAAVEALMATDDPPTALFTGQNLITVGAVCALRTLGRSNDVALVGFDDFQLADLLEPAVTVVAQDPDAIGRIAAERLVARIAGDRAEPRLHVVPTRLVPRGSGELAPPR